MNVYELLDFLEQHFPARFAMQDDKNGLEIQIGSVEIKNVLVTHELTEKVIEEAVKLECQLILTYHPFIYFPIKNIYSNDRLGKLLTNIIKNDLSIVSLHTRFDTYNYGSNYLFAKALGLEIDGFLENNKENDNFGMGIIGHLKTPITSEDFLNQISMITKSVLRYSEGNKNQIYKVGIVAGSGKEFLSRAIENNLDAFITSDISYHYFHSTDSKLWLIDPGHYETEQFIVPALTEFLEKNLLNKNINFFQSKINTNPVKYYTQSKKLKYEI